MPVLASRMPRISFRARLGSLIAAAVGVTVAVACVVAYFTVRHQLLSQVDSALVSDLVSAKQLGDGADPQFPASRVAGFLAHNNDSVLQLVTPQRTVVSSYPGAPILPVTASQAAIANTENAYSIETVHYQGVPYRVITASSGYDEITTSFQQIPLAIQIARPLSDINHTLDDLRLILWLVTMAGVGVSVALGFVIGKATLRPVERLTAAAEHVAATQNLSATIEERGDDELARLARAFNSMLTALASSRQQQAQLISDAGHELRTPITSLRTNIEVLMRVPELPAADRAELVADVQAQLEELTTLIGDVVDLAREDERRDIPIEVRFDAILEHAVERAHRRAPTVEFDTKLTPGSIRAQPALLERAVLNVLDNAAKWSPPGSKVTVSLQRADKWLLDIRDQGPGIAASDLSHIFDRFYRAEAARALPGSGLGLAIVRQVITEHGGTVTASSPAEGGTLIHIELPIVAESEPEPQDAGAYLFDAPYLGPPASNGTDPQAVPTS